IYLRSTLAYCSDCGQSEFARIVARPSGVYMERMCPATGGQRVRIAADPAWYRARTAMPRQVCDSGDRLPSKLGCPHDCGPCQWHSGGLHLPVFSITNDCNLDCPICFTYNRPDLKYYKSVEETRRIIGHILDHSRGVQLINLTGGEPTLHPQLFEIIEACKQEGIGRVTMNTNGLKIAGDRRFAERIKDAGVQLVLSLDTLDPENSRRIHGKDITKAKRKCLEALETLEIPTTLLPVCIKGVNETDVVEIVHNYFHKPFVRSITIQNMTYTGENGSLFEPREHITLDEVEALLVRPGHIARSDFFPLSAYHPLCYSAAYYLMDGETMIPLAELFEPEQLAELTADTYFIDPLHDFSIAFRDGINRLWAAGADQTRLHQLRDFLTELYPEGNPLTSQQRQQILEQRVKMILIHPHMDRDNFDIDRVSSCGDLVPDELGRMVPACAYNLLYRQRDPRFWREPI
ncbi:MAG: radical SAM protein, partial [Candidatus Thiodiazotropha endolucinida]